MYKIMIGDDEGIVIDALTFIIKRNFGDICVIESAKTGRVSLNWQRGFIRTLLLWIYRCLA